MKREMLRPIGAIENLFSAYNDLEAMTFAMAAEIELAAGPGELVNHSPFDMIVTNLCIVEAGLETFRPRAVSVFGPIIKPFKGCDIIAVFTFSGGTTLIHSSMGSNGQLLQRVASVLVKINLKL